MKKLFLTAAMLTVFCLAANAQSDGKSQQPQKQEMKKDGQADMKQHDATQPAHEAQPAKGVKPAPAPRAADPVKPAKSPAPTDNSKTAPKKPEGAASEKPN
jgi:hypothetical protein